MNSKTAMLICFLEWFRAHLAQLRCNLSMLPCREHSQCFLFGNVSCTAAVSKFMGEGHIFWKLVNAIYQFWNLECASRLISQHQTHSKQKKNGQQNSIIIYSDLTLLSHQWVVIQVMALLSDPSGKREFRFSIKSSILAQGFSVSVHLVAGHCDLNNPVKSVPFQT